MKYSSRTRAQHSVGHGIGEPARFEPMSCLVFLAGRVLPHSHLRRHPLPAIRWSCTSASPPEHGAERDRGRLSSRPPGSFQGALYLVRVPVAQPPNCSRLKPPRNSI